MGLNFNALLPNYLNYAYTGHVIGHEFGHGFDNDGINYYDRGKLDYT